MKLLLNLLIFGLILAMSSCTNKKPTPLTFDNSFAGKWELNSKKQKGFISFSENKFSTNILAGSDTINGEWTFDSNKSALELTSYVQNTSFTIDSSVVNMHDNEISFIHFKDGKELIIENESSIKQSQTRILNAKIKNQKLILSENKGTNWGLHRPTEITTKTEPAFNITSILRGLLGMAFLIGFAWLFSTNRRKVNWGLIGKGLILQFIIAILVLKVPAVAAGFDFISSGFVWVIGMTDNGVDFLFGQFGIGVVQAPLLTFAIKVLPTIIFFSALVSLFYYWGILQKIVYIFAWVMKKFMRLSGAESLAAAGNVFLGQTEAPLLVKPYLLGMTKSEIMCLMTGGMATIAGGVLAAYVNFLGGDDPVQQAFFAKHLLTASIISAPAAIIAAKILVPETEAINENLSISKEKIGTNALEAISNGTSDGLRLAVNVGAMLLVFIAIMALGNGILGKIGSWTGINEQIAAGGIYSSLSFEFLLGYTCRPIVWMMGIDWVDSIYVGELLGTKTVLNEFVAYPRLGEMKEAGMINQKSIIMSTYMLCGFANFASIGIQIGGIGSLVPTRKGLLSKLGIQALIGGTIACLLTSVIVGMTM